ILPVVFHVDGAEFYKNNEYVVWSMSSIHAKADVWDCKLPLCIVPHVAMRDDSVAAHVHKRVAEVLAWSMECAATGLGPKAGEDGLPFQSAFRHRLKGQVLPGGYKLAYTGFKADMKARMQANRFERYYNCDLICEACFAEKAKPNKTCPFTDFSETACHRLTRISHTTYMRTASEVSPWACMPGWNLHTVLLDMMHILYLGTLRVMISSCIVFWIRFKALGGGTIAHQLLRLSSEMRQKSRENGIRLNLSSFTPSNVGIASGLNDNPELCSTFKAAAVKSSLWFLAWKAEEISKAQPEVQPLKFVSLCVWSIHSAVVQLDHAGLLMDEDTSKVAYRHIRRHLTCWQWLASFSQSQGWHLWRLKPKHHYFDHISDFILRTRINPSIGAVWEEESFLGRLKKIAIRCHSATTMKRLMQRYLLMMGLRLEESRRVAQQIG
ncbi:unnamed protein product, partial [Symbiodinium necroappetens]